ncbi:hypothetical protein J4E86_011166 [Alternaria arbusti]|uniref:uncharacterized protein n=1 Tax=Alternaria arbusti TaxID=232088 RepID=UPI002220BB0F|nr:uncharacterized protein J4E86_011166 [Alternaria arbusti]KAI4940200.1 hypothetical protein J4E86_011166 [Alternaria arbusti]
MAMSKYESIMWQKEMKDQIIKLTRFSYMMSQDIPIHVIVVKETNTSARPDGSSKSAYSAHIFAGDTLKSRERLMSTQRKLTEESSLEMLLEMVQEPLVFMLKDYPEDEGETEEYQASQDPFTPHPYWSENAA